MHTSIHLGVNIDHVATIRQARGTTYPEPVQAALIAEQSGADAITIHLREDRRHIIDKDVVMLNDVIQTRMNLEIAATDEMADIAQNIKPHCVCIVPEKREELTTEGGLDMLSLQYQLEPFCRQLAQSKIEVSLFIDPDTTHIDAAKACGVPTIELHTGSYADAKCKEEQMAELERIRKAAAYAHQLGIQVNAGHGLHYHNVGPIAQIREIQELNIGHSIIARAVFSGLSSAVADMKMLMVEARQWQS